MRLLRGDMQVATVFSDSAGLVARDFATKGAEWLHVIDLNGAFAGHSVNGDSVRAILAEVSIPLQLGGGIRSLDDIAYWLNLGVKRVILGTIAVRNLALVEEAVGLYGDRIAVSLDSRGGRLAVSGWAEITDIDVFDFACGLRDLGVATLVHTDIERDGAMGGVNFVDSEALAQVSGLDVIASGGAQALSDVARALAGGKGSKVSGLIMGRALYDGAIDLGEALSLCRAAGRVEGGEGCCEGCCEGC